MLGAALQSQHARVYHDLAGVEELKALAGRDRERGVEEVARQFEGMLLQMMLSSMRQAGQTFAEGGLFDTHAHRTYQDMMDQQMALDLAHGGGIGLAEIIVRQLSPDTAAAQNGNAAATAALDTLQRLPVQRPAPAQRGAALSAAQAHGVDAAFAAFDGPEDFVQRLYPLARDSAAELGVSPEVLLAQAALETGWGRHLSRDADGRSSNNFFNIKADHRWHGPAVNVSTLEYRDGVAVRERARFRAYDSAEQSFADYVAFIRDGRRYQPALAHSGDDRGYVRELAAAGYATDPAYAEKVLALVEGDVIRRAGAHHPTPEG